MSMNIAIVLCLYCSWGGTKYQAQTISGGRQTKWVGSSRCLWTTSQCIYSCVSLLTPVEPSGYTANMPLQTCRFVWVFIWLPAKVLIFRTFSTKMNNQEVTFASFVAFNVFLVECCWSIELVSVKLCNTHEEKMCITNLKQTAWLKIFFSNLHTVEMVLVLCLDKALKVSWESVFRINLQPAATNPCAFSVFPGLSRGAERCDVMSINTSFWTDESTCVLIDLNHIKRIEKKHTHNCLRVIHSILPPLLCWFCLPQLMGNKYEALW